MRCVSHSSLRGTVRWVGILANGVLLIAGWTASVSAQLPQPRLYSVFPVGAQRGVAVDVTLSNGVDLDDSTELIFSNPGIKAIPKVNMQTTDRPA
jgi:hypothetical protein